MRTKRLIGCGLLISIIASCSNGNSSGQETDEETETSTTSQATDKNSSSKNSNWEKLVAVENRDANGNLVSTIPLPSNWKIHNIRQKGDPTFTGPDGIVVKDYPIQMFNYPFDQNTQYLYSQSGQQVRDFPGVEQVIQQDLIPVCRNQGLSFIKYYELPDVSRIEKWYSDQLYQAVPNDKKTFAIGTDWQTADGNPYFLIVHFSISTTEQLRMWSYFVSSLEADKDVFEKAKKQLLFSISNVRYELEPIMAYNRSEAEKAGRSWAQFNARMAQNQANFEASQRAHINKTNAINDAIMSGWRERNAASDRMQEQRIDGIYERTNVVDESGQKYKVESGYNQYWMNNDGEYISTDKVDYNPNLDDNMNDQKWQELKEIK
ncbi:MAG TPA: hypothetical protein PKV02_09755 [Bacteroidia bacterium]|nr:hypothetical protein [Bacteroidia bacterium]